MGIGARGWLLLFCICWLAEWQTQNYKEHHFCFQTACPNLSVFSIALLQKITPAFSLTQDVKLPPCLGPSPSHAAAQPPGLSPLTSVICVNYFNSQIPRANIGLLLPVTPSFPFLQRHLAPRQSQKALPRSYLRARVDNHSSSAAPRLPSLLRRFRSLCKHQSSGLPEAAHHRWSSLEDQVAGGVRQHMERLPWLVKTENRASRIIFLLGLSQRTCSQIYTLFATE